MEKWRCDVTAKPGPQDPGSLYHTKYLDETHIAPAFCPRRGTQFMLFKTPTNAEPLFRVSE
jgi:hypothetical protein